MSKEKLSKILSAVSANTDPKKRDGNKGTEFNFSGGGKIQYSKVLATYGKDIANVLCKVPQDNVNKNKAIKQFYGILVYPDYVAIKIYDTRLRNKDGSIVEGADPNSTDKGGGYIVVIIKKGDFLKISKNSEITLLDHSELIYDTTPNYQSLVDYMARLKQVEVSTTRGAKNE